VTIRYTITGTATPGTDYQALSGTVTIGAGETVSAPVIVTPSGDSRNEPTENVTVTVGENQNYVVGAADTATVRILDSNPPLTSNDNSQILRFNSGGNFVGGHATFTAAVAAASNNDILVARAGTYNEPGPVFIDKPLIIRGPNAGISPSSGSSVPSAVVVPQNNQPAFTIAPGTNNVTIEGLTIRVTGDNSNAIRLQGASDNLLIRQNEFTGKGPSNGGVIFLDANGGASTVEVVDNLIRDVAPGSDPTSGIQVFRINTVRVTDNIIANLNGPGIAADSITNPASAISHNQIDNVGEQGIQLASGSATIDNNDITNANTIQDPERGGIRLRNSVLTNTPLGTVNVLGNTITNSFNGVVIRADTTVPGTVAINNNNLIGNTNAGFFHGGTGSVNAKDNWWDDPAGPTLGSGRPNAIAGPSNNLVVFTPFSTTPL
jgi:hypothetical protein